MRSCKSSKLQIRDTSRQHEDVRDLMLQYRWPGMKQGVSRFVSHCRSCQRVKAEHQKPGRLL